MDKPTAINSMADILVKEPDARAYLEGLADMHKQKKEANSDPLS